MRRRPPYTTRPDTLVPYTTPFRSAPDYEPAARDYAKKKAIVRLLKLPHGDGRNNVDVKRVGSGLLMQDSDNREVARDELKVAGKRAPSDAELDTLLFA